MPPTTPNGRARLTHYRRRPHGSQTLLESLRESSKIVLADGACETSAKIEQLRALPNLLHVAQNGLNELLRRGLAAEIAGKHFAFREDCTHRILNLVGCLLLIEITQH